jgi:endoglucanase
MSLVSGPLSVSGSKILDVNGQPVRLTGVNWGGAQQDELLPGGLDKLPRGQIIERIIGWGMNSVRFPFALGTFVSNDGTLKTGLAKPSRVAANPDLADLTPGGVFYQLVDEMTAAGLYVFINQHLLYQGWCCATEDNNGLWYNDNWPSSTFTNVWLTIARRFAGNPLVGYDLHNEPRPATIGGKVLTPTWGSGNGATDMRQLYQNTVSRIRAVDRASLCFCEGLKYAQDLSAWKAHPVTGANVAVSAHDYPWFHRHADQSPQTKAEYYAQNDASFGYLSEQGIAPVWIGECGTGTDASVASLRGGWFPNFLAYAADRDVHWCWWELSATNVLGTQPSTNKVQVDPGAREGFGLMAGQDWRGSQTTVLDMLAPVM